MSSGRIPNYMINIHTLLTGSNKWTHRHVNNTYVAGKHLISEMRPCQTHKRSLVWSKGKRGSGGGKEGAYHDWAARLRPAHVCVSNYSRNLLQALARAATERWMAYRIKARVVGKGVVERNSERERTIFRNGKKNQADLMDKEFSSRLVWNWNMDGRTKAVCLCIGGVFLVWGRRQWSYSALSKQH